MDDKVQELLNMIRSTTSIAAETATDTARAAVGRAGQMMDIAKLNVQLFDLNNEFDDILKQLGRVMYDTHTGRQVQADVHDVLTRADATAQQIAGIKDKIALLRQSGMCPACGELCGKTDQFCRRCGTHL